MRKVYTCTCGEERVAVDAANSGEIREQTGFRRIGTHEGKAIWLCPACRQKVHEAARLIHGIVKDEFLCFSHLLRE